MNAVVSHKERGLKMGTVPLPIPKIDKNATQDERRAAFAAYRSELEACKPFPLRWLRKFLPKAG
jgi:hypothetical protein